MSYKTREGVKAVRKELQSSKVVNMNAQIASDIDNRLSTLNDKGTMPLVELASVTFLLVNKAIFGNIVPPSVE